MAWIKHRMVHDPSLIRIIFELPRTSKGNHRLCKVKGEVSRKFAVISKPENVCLSGRNNDMTVKFVINSAIKLSIIIIHAFYSGHEKCNV